MATNQVEQNTRLVYIIQLSHVLKSQQ